MHNKYQTQVKNIRTSFGTYIGKLEFNGNWTIIREACQLTMKQSNLNPKLAVPTFIGLTDLYIKINGPQMITEVSDRDLKVYAEARQMAENTIKTE